MRSPDRVQFTVLGVPQSQGSMKSFRSASTGRIVTVSDNAKLRPWRQEAGWAAKVAAKGAQFDGAVKVSARFVFVRPKSVKRERHTVKPDVEKLARALSDAMTGIIWRDDAQVVEMAITKAYGLQARTDVVIEAVA